MRLVRKKRDPAAIKEEAFSLPWKILVIDDDPSVHTLTQLILKRMEFAGRKIQLFSAYSAQEAKEILHNETDIAVALVDVVMETEHAGLELVDYIRGELENRYVRLIIRTGQAGSAPEREVIDQYDIDDYKDKTELTAQKLYTTIRSALKAYRDIMIIESNRQGLERILQATPGLYLPCFDSIDQFFQGVLQQLIGLCNLGKNGLLCTINGFISTFDRNHSQIRAGTGDFALEQEDQQQHECIELIRTCSEIIREGRTPRTGELKPGSLLLPIGNEGSEKHIQGFIYLENTSVLTRDDRHLIQIMVNQCAAALENLQLHFELKEANQESLYMLAMAAEFKDQETGDHLHRISEYTRLLALDMGMKEEEARSCAQASILHDIGKLGIPDAILQKPGDLTEEELAVMRTHTTLGKRILERHQWFQLASEIALNHHERWDGSGYPGGLKGDDIPLAARIVSVADVYDALYHKRSYKEAWAPELCLAHLQENAGTQFDPAVVAAFVRLAERGVMPVTQERMPTGKHSNDP
ncbi:HD domain-containing phosphohydrolase [Candidatus Electrothrix sp.]|uniref:HD domain-containing phosphohydrolase n=1 Tax=Candidatus Electrothrix sp. TaxID=2170559 RepID=UPI0040571E51